MIRKNLNQVKKGAINFFHNIKKAQVSVNGTPLSLTPIPIEVNNVNVVYDKKMSVLDLPIEVNIQDIENLSNKYLTGLIYENSIIKVWKRSPIKIVETNGSLDIELPLTLRATHSSLSSLGEFTMNGKVKIRCKIIFQNWHLEPYIDTFNIEWIQSPTVSIMGKNISVLYVVNPIISLFSIRIQNYIYEFITSLDIKSHVLNILERVSHPVEINKIYHIWISNQPIELYTTGPAVIANKKIKLNAGIKTYLETTIGTTPLLRFDRNKLQLTNNNIGNRQNSFNVNLPILINYSTAANLIEENLLKEKIKLGPISISIVNINLQMSIKNSLIVEIKIGKGPIKTQIHLSAVPRYDSQKEEIHFDEMFFLFDSEKKILNLGILTNVFILEEIKKKCYFSIANQLAQAKEQMSAYLNNYQIIQGLTVTGELNQLSPDKIILTPNALIGMITATGQVGIGIDGLE